ncbi:hypothetical protein [Protofrankia symbiont of Coriaria ruscifolia]|uniref:Putative membrane protein n=1 Tax=Candidatus Protofrankia californiensis TaxID=1839754 RepID=A0A1C3P6W2_9ACTN|nr:hypothetical protein [Protofrankia symbiont of Coriaria ruscifolia]SBW25530.1 putative membrane protein [Candidatus Protofrankia californiensis]
MSAWLQAATVLAVLAAVHMPLGNLTALLAVHVTRSDGLISASAAALQQQRELVESLGGSTTTSSGSTSHIRCWSSPVGRTPASSRWGRAGARGSAPSSAAETSPPR